MAKPLRLPIILLLLAALPGHAAEPAQPGSDDAASALSQELVLHQNELDALRGELGAYHPALTEAYGELGNLYFELEDFEQSLSTFNDALEVARINEGLYSESQLRIIDSMIAGNVSLADWETVDDLHHFRYHMAGRLWELTDSRHLTALGEYGGWKLKAIGEGLLRFGNFGIQGTIDDVDSSYRRTIEALELETEPRPLDLAGLVHGKAELDIFMIRATAATPVSYFPANGSRYVNQMRCRTVRGPGGQAVQQCVNVQVENPRYRSSQRTNKRAALMRYSTAISGGIEKLTAIREGGNGLSEIARTEIDGQIAQLQAEYQRYSRVSVRDTLF